jgi:lysophospholipase L1-like esterase
MVAAVQAFSALGMGTRRNALPGTVVFLGDSITYGFNGGGAEGADGYANGYKTKMSEVADFTLANYSAGGRLLQDMNTYASTWQALYDDANGEVWAVLYAGANDIKLSASLATMQARLDACLGHMATAGPSGTITKRVLVTVGRWTAVWTAAMTEVAEDYDDYIKTKADANTFVFDLETYPNLADRSDLTYYDDGIHPTAVGHQEMADELAAFMRSNGAPF